MSSRDPRAAALGLLAACATVLVVGGCASPADTGTATTTGAVPADDVTHRIAEVEFARQCEVSSLTFPDESAITTDLDTRLAAAGLTHQQWKDWHDSLVDSPDLVAQLVDVSTPGCAGG